MGSKRVLLMLLCVVVIPAVAFGQQTGGIVGRVIGTDNLVIPGVTVEARSNVLPGPRVTVTSSVGEYRLPALPPGEYAVAFELSGMAKVTKQVQVQLAQDATLNVTMSVGGVTETVTVTAQIVPVIDKDSTAIKSGVSSQTIQSLPTGQEYRDLIKLIPGVQLTQDGTRGPSAGGSGQDNVYKFDGVNVTMPLFGTLSAEPAAYDIAEVTTIKGGAKAVDFERSGGFSVDSVSKTGTSRYSGQVSYQFQTAGMASKVQNGSLSKYSQGLSWLTANVGGPVIPNHAFFYGSYYRPERDRANRANLYGNLPDYKSTRNEGFGKMTLTPTSNILLNASYRYSHRLDKSDLFAQSSAATTGTGYESWQRIATADGSWIINSRSFASFKYTHYENPNQGRPDNVSNAEINTTIGTRLDVNNLDTLGRLEVPNTVAGQDAYNAFIQPLIDRYGYTSSAGVKTGGGFVGYGYQFDKDDFFRNSWQVAYNLNLGSTTSHDIHFGYQRYTDSEDLLRSSNGWGRITVPGGRSASLGINGIPAYYMVQFQQQSTGAVPPIHSSYWSQSVEANDTIRHKNWSFNLGLLASNDRLYGQGLKGDSTTVSGYVASPGTVYKMYEIPFKKMLQPRVGATWAYNGQDTIYASFATYVPAASSLPRAASWARNLAVEIFGYFDANGVLYGTQPNAASTGKLFVEDMTPKTVTEYLLGTSRQFSPHLTGRAYLRYRYADHFWEDTNNNARLAFSMPAGWGPSLYYIGDLATRLAQIGTGGSGNSYIITELDRAYTKYYEATVESEYRSTKLYVRGSYTWSKYYGNFDQDNTSGGASNDANLFIGSSNIGDGAGRQLWNSKEGRLHGDRPHSLKIYAYYQLPWNASIGAFALAQSGQPWEATSYEPYIALTTSTSDTNRYAEPAGSRRTAAWYQLDLNYTQNVSLTGHYKLQLVGDLYNVTNTQTGYNYTSGMHSSTFNQPQSFLSPRRIQVSARFQF
ncbi:MAG: carboxypeptidase regulatory-like domain-containing protein [Acidobacteria bacterium]|nr:carboxypeptidase regulatory-like domain-containing protein [Acidobacteriota bacterium]